MLQSLRKPAIKQHLNSIVAFLCECISDTATTESRARSWAAGDAIAFLRRAVGRAIFDGRLSSEQAATIAGSDAVPSASI